MLAALNDIELITAFQRGENAAVRQLYDLHFVPLSLFAFRITRQQQDAEDMVTESFVKLLQKRNDFDSLPKIKSFLYQVTRNACIDQIRSKEVRNTNHSMLRFMNPESEEATDYVNEELLRLEVIAAIHAEIESLPERRKEIFKLLFFEQLSTEEIGERLQISAQTVRSQKALALQEIKSNLLKKNLVMALFYISLHFSADRVIN